MKEVLRIPNTGVKFSLFRDESRTANKKLGLVHAAPLSLLNAIEDHGKQTDKTQVAILHTNGLMLSTGKRSKHHLFLYFVFISVAET